MKYASVCSGVEAASLAWMPLGWKATWFSEIEPFPCAVLKERFPNVPNLGDMTKIKVENLENGDQKFTSGDGTVVLVPGGVDLLVGGTPCQSFSVAGKREGLDGASGLAKTFVELLDSMRPRWFVWENVPGCLSSRDKQTGVYDFNFLLAAFAEVWYCCGWRILDAQYVRVDGYPRAIPQRRRRVFVVGHLGAQWQYPAEVLFEPHSLSGNTPPRRVKGQGTAADAQRCLGTASTLRMRAGCEGGGKGALVSHERSLTLAAAGNDQAVFTDRPWDNSGVNPTLNQCGAANGTPGSSNQELFSQNFNGLVMSIGNGQVDGLINEPELAQTLHCMHDQQAVLCLNDQGGSVMNIENDGNAGTLRANTHGNEQIVCQGEVISCNSKKMGLGVSTEVNGTLNAADYKEPQIVCYENHANDSRVKNMGECCQTLEARAGMGGGNLPLVQECYSVDRRNQTVDAELSGTLTNCGGGDNYNTVMESIAFEPGIAKREGGHSRFTEGVSSTLRSDMGDNQTAVATMECFPINSMVLGKDIKEGDRQGTGIGNSTDPSPTLGTSQHHAVAIVENIIGRQVQNGGNGTGAQEELAYTQNASGVMGVAVNNNEGEDYGDATKTRSLQVLLDLRNKIGEKAFQQWAFGRLIGFQKEEILQQELYEQSLQGKTEEKQSELDDSPLSRTELDAENALLRLWQSSKPGYPPYRQELAQQFIGQLDLLMQKLSCQNTSRKHATVRRLLPIETERLMGFPDNHTRIAWKGKPAEECPDSPRYKACGNSMCVNVMRWLGMRIELVERRLGR